MPALPESSNGKKAFIKKLGGKKASKTVDSFEVVFLGDYD